MVLVRLSVLPDQSERPIAFASRSLTKSERNYSQLDKEALALVFSVKKFHDYLYRRKFTLLTDHKPLLSILGSKQGVPPLAAARLQRWAVVLSAYTYDIVFKPTKAHMLMLCLAYLSLLRPILVLLSLTSPRSMLCLLPLFRFNLVAGKIPFKFSPGLFVLPDLVGLLLLLKS